jgi:hypothetical protein
MVGKPCDSSWRGLIEWIRLAMGGRKEVCWATREGEPIAEESAARTACTVGEEGLDCRLEACSSNRDSISRLWDIEGGCARSCVKRAIVAWLVNSNEFLS